MPQEVKLMQTGANKSECKIAEWLVADGAHVQQGESIFTMETDKVSVEVEADEDGILRHLVAAGDSRMSGEVVGMIYLDGEAVPDTVVADDVKPAAEAAVSDDQTSAVQAQPNETVARIAASPKARKLAASQSVDLGKLTGTGGNQRIISRDVQAFLDQSAHQGDINASPLARRIAAQQQVNLTDVSGTGSHGKIMKQDVLDHRQAPAANDKGYIAVPHSPMRKVIARRMHESLQSNAQLSMHREVLMAETIRLRNSLNAEWQAEGIKISFTDIIIKAVAKALKQHTAMNSSFTEDELQLWQHVHMGMAVAVDDGLFVPVIRDADKRSLKDIALESRRLVEAARSNSLKPQDLQDGTFTISTLGMFGIDSFTPIINQPQCGILGVNRIYDGIEWDGETPIKTPKMNLSLSWDHRALDGAPAAAFLATVADMLANPYRLLV